MMRKVYNFSAGPSMLSEKVLQIAQKEMLDYNGSGMSVMELSHRSAIFTDIIQSAERLLRDLMEIPENYKVLFIQGGASTQFAMVPLNLFRNTRKADYVLSGAWAKKAASEAGRFGEVRIVASSEDNNFTSMPPLDPDDFSPDADYFHITTNNTIYGTRFTLIPDTGSVPLVADMSSNILSERYDVTQFGLIYAGAQKNIAPAGLTIVIVRDDLIGHALDITPTMLNYKTHAEKDSLFNTPPCYCIYIAKLTFEWIQDQGGVQAIEEINREKAHSLYDFLDNSKMFSSTVKPEHRSIMNITFTLPSEELTKKCIAQASDLGLVTLKGHRSVGGMRASIYNAMPPEGVKTFVDFLKNFEKSNS